MVVFDRALPYGTKKSSPTKHIQVELDGTFKLKNWNPKFEAFKDALPFLSFFDIHLSASIFSGMI